MAALTVALLPVLLLGALQSAIAFRGESAKLTSTLALAAERSASIARARLEAADILLETLTPGSVGVACAQRLAEISRRVPGYENLIRFDRAGRVACAAGNTPTDTQRARRAWFQRLAAGDDLVVTTDPGATYAGQPALIAAVRAHDPDGRFDGALVAVISLASLRPPPGDPSLPAKSDVALIDSGGRYINLTDVAAFPPPPANWRARAANRGSVAWAAKDRRGDARIYSAAPLVDDEVFVVVSAHAPGLFSWARLNPLTGVLFPLLTFALALIAVAIVIERVVLRWIVYLQRIADLYARGRLSVRPVKAPQMPPEIRELAMALEGMADGIVGRDVSLRDTLAQKDALMREIHHRVKNNLQVISSLLNMQQRSLSDPAARAAMSDTRQRITALALIYRALYQGPDLKRVDLRPFLEELTAQLVAGETLHGPPVRTEIRVDALVIDPDRLAPLALFAVEAVTNAQKHAFANRGGTLIVSFKVTGDSACLEIADDGLAPEGALSTLGVGRTLMTAFARQLRGRAELDRNGAGGVTARLVFPTPALREIGVTQAAVGNSAPA
jgi:two-component sensor histidine kinase